MLTCWLSPFLAVHFYSCGRLGAFEPMKARPPVHRLAGGLIAWGVATPQLGEPSTVRVARQRAERSAGWGGARLRLSKRTGGFLYGPTQSNRP